VTAPIRACALLLVATAGVVAVGAARADVLCVKRSGRVIGRPACKARERLLDPATLGLLGLVGPPGDGGPPGSPGEPGGHPYRILDSLGRPFGLLLGLDFRRARVEVTLPDGTPVQFVVAPGNGFSTEITPVVYYEQAGCAGPPLVFGSAGLVPSVVVVGTVGYYASAAPEATAIASQEVPLSGMSCSAGTVATGRGTCCQDIAGSAYATPARTMAIATLGVTPPFTVQR
jgi:hypothetical protein